MKNENLTPKQQIQLEQDRLKISGAVLRAKEERLQTLSNRFRFDNADVLDVQFAEYQRLKKSFEKAYGVIATLTPDETAPMMGHLQARHQIAQECLDLAEKREKENLQKFRFFAIIAHIFGQKREPATPIFQPTSKTR